MDTPDTSYDKNARHHIPQHTIPGAYADYRRQSTEYLDLLNRRQAYDDEITKLDSLLNFTDTCDQRLTLTNRLNILCKKRDSLIRKMQLEKFALEGIRPIEAGPNLKSHQGQYTDITNPNKQLFYELHITDPALPLMICIPGVGTNGSNFHLLASRVSSKVNSIIFDRYNQGYSSDTQGIVPFEQQVSDLTAAITDALTKLSNPLFYLVGHSYGGNIAQSVVAKLSQPPTQLIMISSAEKYGVIPASKNSTKAVIMTEFSQSQTSRSLLSRLASNPLVTYLKNRRKKDTTKRSLSEKNPRLNAEKAEQKYVRTQSFMIDTTLSIPTTYIGAQNDFLAPVHALKTMASRTMGRYLEVKNAAHSAPITASAALTKQVAIALGIQDTQFLTQLDQDAAVSRYIDNGGPLVTPPKKSLLETYFKVGNFSTKMLAGLRNRLKI